MDAQYDHRPQVPDDYWDICDYMYGKEQQRKMDAMPDGAYEDYRMAERGESC